MTPAPRPPAAGSWLVWALIALFAAAMLVRSLARLAVTDAAWWTLLLLISVLAWFWTRAHWRRDR